MLEGESCVNKNFVQRESFSSFLKGLQHPMITDDFFELPQSDDIDFTTDELDKILEGNCIGNYDPLEDIYNTMKPIDQDTLNFKDFFRFLETAGLGDTNNKDKKKFEQLLDLDGDGKISLEDFKGFINILSEGPNSL